ncbi:MAG: hypothetical protein Q9O74_08240 [Planctomycetota bacterium]|nr:hypothetical protein [Planctomycetota bacterium]
MPAIHPIQNVVHTTARLALALCAACALSGCGPGSSSGATTVKPGATESEIDLSPVVRGADAGLEARLWAVQARPGLLAAVLGEFGPPTGADARQVARWQQNGMRVVEVPLDQLDWVHAQLPTIGTRNREWLGMLPEWVEVVSGTTLAGERAIRLDSGEVRLGPGRLRMMARCWAMPDVGRATEHVAKPDAGVGVGTLLRIELMPELRMPRQAHDESLGLLFEDAVSSGEPGAQGIAFDRLVLSWQAAGTHALVIVAERTDADWSEPVPRRPESSASGAQVFGPPAVVAPTLGELMLTNLTAPDMPGDARVVIVLVPRVPERFGVLPRSR